MEPIDQAYEACTRLVKEIQDYSETMATEADTRLKAIDRYLIEILGWRYKDIRTEQRAGSGFIDYSLSIETRSRLIVEAKKDALNFGLDGRHSGKAFKLSGPILNGGAIREGIDQAVLYCAWHNTELAAVTNGHQWVVFRGSRCGDGRSTTDGSAFVFSTAEGILENFRLFYDLLSSESVRNYVFRAHLNEAEGVTIRATGFQRALRRPVDAITLERPELLRELDPIMGSFFQRLSGDNDRELLRACFVDSPASRRADEELARVSDILLRRVETLNTRTAGRLQEKIQDAQEHDKKGYIVIVGTKGAGKSTFIDRFFESVLAPRLRRRCAIARGNLAEASGDSSDVVQWLNTLLVRELEGSLYHGEGPSFEDLKGLYYDEYNRLKNGPYRPMYERNREEFQERFGVHIEDLRKSDPHGYVVNLVRRGSSGHGKLPVIVLDNADHHSVEFQQAVYQYARSIYEGALCLILLPITDRTSWEISRQGALQSFEHDSLFLPAPRLSAILQKRIEFVRAKAGAERETDARQYFLGKGVKLELRDIGAFADCLQHILVTSPRVSRMVGALGNFDVRRSLELCRDIVGSPHLGAWELLKADVFGSMEVVPLRKVERAIICRYSDIYNAEDHKFVRNVFFLSEKMLSSPLCALSILQCLHDAPRDQHSERFVAVDAVLEYLYAMRIEETVAAAVLDELLKTDLVHARDPRVEDLENADSVRLTPAGLQHLRWMTSFEYIGAMSMVTPLLDQSTFEDLVSALREPGKGLYARIIHFGRYCLDWDASTVMIPGHEAYRGQSGLRVQLSRTTDDAATMLQRADR